MGEVYRARDHRLGREVAIKVLPATYSENRERLHRFEQEARAAAGLNHPNLLAVYDIGTQNGAPFMVTELLEGETLRDRLRGDALPVRKAIDYGLQIARGLAAAHEKGIVHRDLKPENIFIARDGRVKILDFGLAKLIEREAEETPTSAPTVNTTPGLVLGTAGYMSPEQVRGQAVDHRSDVFAYGAILYEMLSGKRAFKGDTSAETMTSILNDDPPEVSENNRNVSPALQRIVAHCLEKNPEERFQSARDIIFDLEGISTESSATKVAQPKTRASRRWIALAGAVVAAVALLSGWAIQSGRWQKVPPTFQRLTFRRGMVPAARFTADGKTVLYSAQWADKPVSLFAVDVDEPSHTRELQLPTACLLAVSPNGELALALEPVIYGHMFCRGTLAQAPIAGGAPRELLDNVEFADWDPAGRQMAVVRAVGAGREIVYPLGKVLYSTTGWISSIRFAPQGDAIAFLEHPFWPDDRGFVAMIDLSGHRKVLTAEFGSADGLSWSADGQEIWFTATPAGSKRSLFAVTRAGKMHQVGGSAGALQLFDVGRDGRLLVSREDMWNGIQGFGPGSDKLQDLSWLDWSRVRDISPDGKQILFSEEGDGASQNYDAYLRSTSGSTPVQLGEGIPFAFSHDGKWALSGTIVAPRVLVLQPTRAGSQRRIERYSIEEYASADFLPGDDRILFCGHETNHGWRFYVQPVSGGAPKAVSAEGLTPFSPDSHTVSPDGKFFLALGPDQQPLLIPLNGGESRRAAGISADEVPWRWADTQSVYVSKRREFPMRVLRVNVFTGERRSWQMINVDSRAGLMAVGALQITPDGKYYAYTDQRAFSELYAVSGMH